MARQRFEEQKKRHEEQAERLKKAKSERQGNVQPHFFVAKFDLQIELQFELHIIIV